MRYRIKVYNFTPEQAGPGTETFKGEVVITCLDGRHEISGAQQACELVCRCNLCGGNLHN